MGNASPALAPRAHAGPADRLAGASRAERHERAACRGFSAKAFVPRRVNARITSRYTIQPVEIGSGKSGRVFVATDRSFKDRLVAIKKITVRREDQWICDQEASIMRRLDHPNICRLLETYEQGGSNYFVLEYCEGGDLFDRIAERGTLKEHEAADVVRQVACALKYAHGSGIAHRDIKPENICFCTNDRSDDQAKVVDWGAACDFRRGSMAGRRGSPSYAAPEVLRAEQGYTAAVDLWSLGVVAHFALSGRQPFEGSQGSQEERLALMAKEQHRLWGLPWWGVPGCAKEVVRGLLRYDPERRLPLDALLAHPWLRPRRAQLDPLVARRVLGNLRHSSGASRLASICAASVARQLDHRSLGDLRRVFREMDANGDGVLELEEVVQGFGRTFGNDSEVLRDVESMFDLLDLDGSGAIDFAEFCAAGIGEKLSTEEHVLWAAFKAFDVQDDNGFVTEDEVRQVVASVHVDKACSREIGDEVVREMFQRLDQGESGAIDFKAWTRLLQELGAARGGQACRPHVGPKLPPASLRGCGLLGDLPVIFSM